MQTLEELLEMERENPSEYPDERNDFLNIYKSYESSLKQQDQKVILKVK